MKILIIGSNGFIGRHCSDYFSINHEVWECDIATVIKPKYRILNPADSDFDKIFQNYKYDVCINCSGAASVPLSLEHPFNDFQLNTVNVFKILDAIRRYNQNCKYINLSSAAVYGNPQSLPIYENISLQPVSPYGIHKEMAETICEEFYRFWGIKSTCIRIFSAYGPGLRKQLLWDLAQKIIFEEKIELFGTGEETRDFIYITDLVRLIECVINNSGFSADIVNAANGEQIKISRIANLIKSAMNSDKPIIFKGQTRKGDPLNWEADMTHASSLGYTKRVKIEDGINNYVKWLSEKGLV